MNNNTICPLCDQKAQIQRAEDLPSEKYVECVNCGDFYLEFGLVAASSPEFTKQQLALVSHVLSRQKDSGDIDFHVTFDWIRKLLKENQLPNPKEMLDNFIYTVGIKTKNLGEKISRNELESLIAQVGATNKLSLMTVVEQAQIKGLVYHTIQIQETTGEPNIKKVRDIELTFLGWEYFESIRKGESESKIAFMAMPFNNKELDIVFHDYWKPAVEASGYKLERLDERQTAGSIDDRMKQKIRRSAFLVRELTESNRGAYWESGFAEGLGKPVIYTCRDDKFKDDSHFDVNHNLCIRWKQKTIKEDAKSLTDVVRETMILLKR